MLDTNTTFNQDMFRLEIIGESFTTSTLSEIPDKINSFTQYWFGRFFSNITHVLLDFSKSEIQDFENRNRVQLNRILTDPLFTFGDNLYPIPPGMMNSYEITIDKLILILKEIGVDKINDDLIKVLNIKHHLFPYSRTEFDRHSSEIGSLFSKIAILNTSARTSLVDKKSIISSKNKLLELTTTNFLRIFKIEKSIKNIEKNFDIDKISEENKKEIKERLLSISYRLSIFAIVVEHLQDIEHNFVECLKQLKAISKRV